LIEYNAKGITYGKPIEDYHETLQLFVLHTGILFLTAGSSRFQQKNTADRVGK